MAESFYEELKHESLNWQSVSAPASLRFKVGEEDGVRFMADDTTA